MPWWALGENVGRTSWTLGRVVTALGTGIILRRTRRPVKATYRTLAGGLPE